MNCADSGGVHERLRAFRWSGALSDASVGQRKAFVLSATATSLWFPIS